MTVLVAAVAEPARAWRGAAAVALALGQRVRGPALVACAAEVRPPVAVPGGPAVRALCRTLRAVGMDATPAGRLVRIAIGPAEDGRLAADDLRDIASLAGAPVVLAAATPLDDHAEALITACDGVAVVAAPGPVRELAATAFAGAGPAVACLSLVSLRDEAVALVGVAAPLEELPGEWLEGVVSR